MTMRDANGTRQRLRAILASSATPCEQWSGADLARMAGISRQRVHKLLPEYAKRARQHDIAKLQAFLDAHPEAVLAKHFGGMSLDEIGDAIGVGRSRMRNLWAAAGMPARALQRGTLDRALARAEFGKRVLRPEQCWNCGVAFDWTLSHEQRFRIYDEARGGSQGGRRRFIVCSHQCGIDLRGLTRDEARQHFEKRKKVTT